MGFSDPSQALKQLVARPQAAFAWSAVPGKTNEFKLTSQTWQDEAWHHDLILQEPAGSLAEKGVAYLVVTGDRVDHVDLPFGQALADASHLPVATLFNVPNQPLYDLREDDLIAFTFSKYLEEQDEKWPLLLPMVNSVVRAMDALQQATKGKISKFIITGESKRGWTAWLVGTLGDPRVIGIAPVAFDNLDFDAQLKYQFESWGKLSEMLGSYSGAGLISEMETPAGSALREIVDPIFSLSSVHVPVLAIRGSNDPYWTADAANLYWAKVRPPKGFLVLPNEGHDFIIDQAYIQALASFPSEIRHPSTLAISATFEGLRFTSHIETPLHEVRLWEAHSGTKDFRGALWSKIADFPGINMGKMTTDVSKPSRGFAAYYLEFVLPNGRGSLTSTIQIVGP
jgi:PhoPQ-activated pathogenicity-related protein